jgi:hypothetical protein
VREGGGFGVDLEWLDGGGVADAVGLWWCSDGEAAARGSDGSGGGVSWSWGSRGSVGASSVEHAVVVVDSVAEAWEADGKSVMRSECNGVMWEG